MVKKLLKKLHAKIKVYILPKQLLLPNVQPTQDEIRQTLQENSIEREWYKHVKSYKSFEEILADVRSKKLARVEVNDNYLPILRLRNPQLETTYPPFLTQATKQLLDEVMLSWRDEVTRQGYSGSIQIAVTSLIRTKAYQEEIVAAGKLADPDSVHTKGEAFDIDAAGYYLDGVPVNARKNKHTDFHRAFKSLHADVENPEYGDYTLYQPEVHEILHDVLKIMHKENKLHFIHEHAGTTNAVFHICRNPAYIPHNTINT